MPAWCSTGFQPVPLSPRRAARGCPCPVAGRSLRASCPTLSRCCPRFAGHRSAVGGLVVASLGQQRRLPGHGQPLASSFPVAQVGNLCLFASLRLSPSSTGFQPVAPRPAFPLATFCRPWDSKKPRAPARGFGSPVTDSDRIALQTRSGAKSGYTVVPFFSMRSSRQSWPSWLPHAHARPDHDLSREEP